MKLKISISGMRRWRNTHWWVVGRRPFTQEEKDFIREIIVVPFEFGMSAQIHAIDGLFYKPIITPCDVEVGYKLNKEMLYVVTLKYGRKNWRGKIIPVDNQEDIYRIEVPKEAIML